MSQQDRIKRARSIIRDFERSRFLFGRDWRDISVSAGEIGLHVEGGNRFQLPFYHVTVEDEFGLYTLSFARHGDSLDKHATAFKFWEEKRIGDSSKQLLEKERQKHQYSIWHTEFNLLMLLG